MRQSVKHTEILSITKRKFRNYFYITKSLGYRICLMLDTALFPHHGSDMEHGKVSMLKMIFRKRRKNWRYWRKGFSIKSDFWMCYNTSPFLKLIAMVRR